MSRITASSPQIPVLVPRPVLIGWTKCSNAIEINKLPCHNLVTVLFGNFKMLGHLRNLLCTKEKSLDVQICVSVGFLTYLPDPHLRWGLLSKFYSFLNFPIFEDHLLPVEYHVGIWQAAWLRWHLPNMNVAKHNWQVLRSKISLMTNLTKGAF